jgi:hypothetical protein
MVKPGQWSIFASPLSDSSAERLGSTPEVNPGYLRFMELQSLRDALSDYFGDDSEIMGPEDETYAWQAIVHDCRNGNYPELLQDIKQLLTLSDEEIFDFLRFSAPAWICEDPASARRSLEVFYAYVSTYS